MSDLSFGSPKLLRELAPNGGLEKQEDTPDLLIREVLSKAIDDGVPLLLELGSSEGVDEGVSVVVVVALEHGRSPISHLVSATV